MVAPERKTRHYRESGPQGHLLSCCSSLTIMSSRRHKRGVTKASRFSFLKKKETVFVFYNKRMRLTSTIKKTRGHKRRAKGPRRLGKMGDNVRGEAGSGRRMSHETVLAAHHVARRASSPSPSTTSSSNPPPPIALQRNHNRSNH